MTAYYGASTLRTALGGVFSATGGETRYPDALLVELVEEYRALIEDSPFGFGVAFTPTIVTDERHQIDFGALSQSPTRGWWPAFITLKHRKVSEVAAVSINGVALASGAWHLDPNGRTVFLNPQSALSVIGPAFGDILATYTHGYDALIAGVLRGCRLYVKNEASVQQGAKPPSAISVNEDATGYGYTYDTPGPGKPTRWPDVNAALRAVTDRRPPVVVA